MATFNSGLRTKMDDPISRSLDGCDAIVQKKYLALTLEFTINCSANDPLIVGRYDCFYRQAVEWRSLNRGHVFYADQPNHAQVQNVPNNPQHYQIYKKKYLNV